MLYRTLGIALAVILVVAQIVRVPWAGTRRRLRQTCSRASNPRSKLSLVSRSDGFVGPWAIEDVGGPPKSFNVPIRLSTSCIGVDKVHNFKLSVLCSEYDFRTIVGMNTILRCYDAHHICLMFFTRPMKPSTDAGAPLRVYTRSPSTKEGYKSSSGYKSC